jgi:hypothetical protein
MIKTSLFERSLLTTDQGVHLAGEDLEAFFLAGVAVQGRTGWARLRVDRFHLQQLPAGIPGSLAEDQPLSADRVSDRVACLNKIPIPPCVGPSPRQEPGAVRGSA